MASEVVHAEFEDFAFVEYAESDEGVEELRFALMEDSVRSGHDVPLCRFIPLTVAAFLVVFQDLEGRKAGWLDVTGAALMWPLLLGVVWWVWRSMNDMKLTPRMPFAWQMMGGAMFTLIRVMVVLGVLSAVLGLMAAAIAVHAQARIPEELVVFGVSVLIGVGATFLLQDSAAGESVRS